MKSEKFWASAEGQALENAWVAQRLAPQIAKAPQEPTEPDNTNVICHTLTFATIAGLLVFAALLFKFQFPAPTCAALQLVGLCK